MGTYLLVNIHWIEGFLILDRIIILFSDINGSLPNIDPTCTKSQDFKKIAHLRERESPWEVEELRFRSKSHDLSILAG